MRPSSEKRIGISLDQPRGTGEGHHNQAHGFVSEGKESKRTVSFATSLVGGKGGEYSDLSGRGWSASTHEEGGGGVGSLNREGVEADSYKGAPTPL